MCLSPYDSYYLPCRTHCLFGRFLSPYYLLCHRPLSWRGQPVPCPALSPAPAPAPGLGLDCCRPGHPLYPCRGCQTRPPVDRIATVRTARPAHAPMPRSCNRGHSGGARPANREAWRAVSTCGRREGAGCPRRIAFRPGCSLCRGPLARAVRTMGVAPGARRHGSRHQSPLPPPPPLCCRFHFHRPPPALVFREQPGGRPDA